MTFRKRQNCGNNKKNHWLAGVGRVVGAGNEEAEHKEFFRAVKIFYMIMMSICQYTFLQADRIHITKSEF